MIRLKIITPRKVVMDTEVDSVSVPSSDGELTILKHHENLFALLIEGIVKIKKDKEEKLLSIGGGYVETNGEVVNVIVSKAYHQDEIDKDVTEQAINQAKKIIKESVDEKEKQEAITLLRRSMVDLKLLKKKAPRSFGNK